MTRNRNSPSSECGNVFFFILIGIVMFASLSFYVAKGMRSQTTQALSARQAELAAADILNYAQALEAGVNRLRSKNISESDISFETAQEPDYAHSPAVAEIQELFHPQGGGVNWQAPAPDVNNGTYWIFTGSTCIADLGTGGAGCSSDGNIRNEEMLAVLSDIDSAACTAINERLNITGIPDDTGGGASVIKFTGDFADDTEIILPGGPFRNICFSSGGVYLFYTVLLER